MEEISQGSLPQKPKKNKFVTCLLVGFASLCVIATLIVVISMIWAKTPAGQLAMATSQAGQSLTKTAKPTEEIDPSKTPKPSRTPVPSKTTRPTKTEVPSRTPKPSKTPVPSKTPRPSNTPRPTSTSVQDGAIQLFMDSLVLTREEATTAIIELNKVGINKINSVVFVIEIPPLKFYDLDIGYSIPATVSFQEKQLFGVLFGPNRVLYDRDAGGVINFLSDYVYDALDVGEYINNAQFFVKQALKAPATAIFPGVIFSRDQYKIWKDHNLVTVKSYVDAENSFGALLRSTYIVQFELQGDAWHLMYLELDGSVVTGTYQAP